MASQEQRRFDAPVFDDSLASRQATLLRRYVRTLVPGLGLVALVVRLGSPAEHGSLTVIGLGAASLLVLWLLARSARLVPLAAWAAVLGCWGVATAGVVVHGTLLTASTSGIVVTVVMAGVLLRRRGLLLVAVLCASTLAGLYLLEQRRFLPPRVYPLSAGDLADWLVLTAAAGLSISWALGLEAAAAVRARRELQERRRAEDEQRRLVEQLSAANESLRQEIAQRESLEAQFRQAQKMEAVGRLAGGVAHDFNNQLTAILGYTELLARRGGEAAARHDLEQIRKAATQAATLTRQLLAFSRKQVLQARVLSPNAVVHDMRSILSRMLGEDVQLEIVLAPDAGNVRTDPGQLQQVIMNLAVNARDAMPHGGRLTLETSNVTLDETYARSHVEVKPGAYVMLAVSDTGCGMSEEVRQHLFEPFFTTKEHGKGTGLGLATVDGIVRQSGGSIGVYSEPGRGSSIKIYLPHVAASEESAPPREPPSPPRQASETILLAEDEELIMQLAERVLVRAGYRVLKARRGDEALALAAEHQGPIDLLITDVVMPGGVSGRDLAHGLSERYPALKVLYVSGYTDNAIVHHGLLDHGVNFLAKPFSVESLCARVREVLDGTGG
jgi:signal transduction histidine kinase/CheY-like chemotaxis protein